MSLNAIIFLVIAGIMFLAVTSYGLYYTRCARKNSEYFALTGIPRDVFRLRKSVKKRGYFSTKASFSLNSAFLVNFVTFLGISILMYSYLRKNDTYFDVIYIFIGFYLFFMWIITLWVILIHKNFFVLEKKRIYSYSIFSKEAFEWTNLKEISIKHIGYAGRVPVYEINVESKKNIIFPYRFALWSFHNLALCVIDSVYGANPQSKISFLEQNGEPMAAYVALIEARKPLGIFTDAP